MNWPAAKHKPQRQPSFSILVDFVRGDRDAVYMTPCLEAKDFHAEQAQSLFFVSSTEP